MKKNISVFALLALLLSLAVAAQQQPTAYSLVHSTANPKHVDSIKAAIRGIDAHVFQPYQFRTIKYRLLTPLSVGRNKRYPLVLVLHGSGAVGTDNISQLGILAKMWAMQDIRKDYPAYVVAPQFPERSSNYVMDSIRGMLVSVPGPNTNTVLQLIDSLKQVLSVDTNRIYVIGFSMGASSVYNSIGLRPGLFAAGVAVSGIPDFNHLPVLASTPLWTIHGNADHENPFRTDSLLQQTLRGSRQRFWEADQLGHEIYSELYTTAILPAWLFSQQR
ncbi:carboxylesterase family protein [Chitinophaga flava]|uniref:Phospholipase n=1 Tax=Chitinophaga flava TaxID=2259036 RepID=A0A365Y1D7_9BACT|nr:phospholipase [Chitinophaga flava]RBL92417.1 phospholipase [Chitinophaga flava]